MFQVGLRKQQYQQIESIIPWTDLIQGQIISKQNNMKIAVAYLSLFVILLPSAYQRELTLRHSLEVSGVGQNQRTDTLYARCPVVRTSFWNRQYNDSLSVGRQTIQASLGVDGDKLIYNVLTENSPGAKQEIAKSMGHLVAFVIFMVIGLVLIGVLAPFLICCYCQPDSCPPCQSCRNPVEHEYSACQKRWPPIVTIFLAVILIGTMIAVLVIQPGLEKGYSETRCATAMLFDDLLNGNDSMDTKDHFIGLKPLQAKLNAVGNEVNEKIQNMNSQAQNNQIGRLVNKIKNHLKDIKRDVSDLPRGDGSSKQADLTYVSPINSPPQSTSPNTKTIQSSFPFALGSTDSQSSLVGSTHAGLNKVEHALGSLFDLTSLLNLALPKLQQQLNQGLQKYDSMVNKVENLDKSTDSMFQKYQTTYVHPFSILVNVLAAVAIAVSILLIIATLLIVLKQKMVCTKVVFGACGLLAFIGFLLFILSLVMSVGAGGTHYGCQYVERGLATNADFKYRFQPIFKHELLTDMMAQCTTQQGNGIVIDENLISQIVKTAKSGAFHLSQLENHHQRIIQSSHKLVATIQSYKHAVDIGSPTDIKILQKISDPHLYSCTAPSFASDSWVPTVDQRSMFIPCKVGKQHLVTKENCPTRQALQTRSGSCTGCIDTFSIFSQFNSYKDVLESLNKRYSSPDCKTFNEELANVWNNFYNKKSSAIGPIQQKSKAISSKIDQLNKLIKQIKPNFKSHLLHFQSHTQFSNPEQPKKINCHVLGEDFRLVTNTFCRNFFNYTYSMRILSIIGGFACLGIMIVATFFGIRVWKIRAANYLQEAKSESSKSNSHKDKDHPDRESL